MARVQEFYKGRRKKKNLAIIPFIVLLALVSVTLVTFYGMQKYAVITKDGHTIRMKVGALTYTVDGVEKTMDVPAEFTPSVNNEFRTMVPVRFVTEALGYQVEWDQSRNLAVIIHPGWGWDPAGETEAKAMDEAVRLLTMYGSFV